MQRQKESTENRSRTCTNICEAVEGCKPFHDEVLGLPLYCNHYLIEKDLFDELCEPYIDTSQRSFRKRKEDASTVWLLF